jgi:integrase
VRPSTARHDAIALGRFKALFRKRVADITPEAAQDIIDRIRAPTSRAESAQRYCNLIRHLIRRGDIAHWPVERLDGRMKPVYRERVLDREELATVVRVARQWQRRGHIYATHGYIVELLILTGQRRQQFGSLEHKHVDFDNDTITWPPELMKTAKRHTIPFGSMTRALLEHRPCGLMFANTFGKPYSFPGSTDRAFRADCGFNGWTLHDLRRTLATFWQEMGIDIATTEKMLSHTAITGGLIGAYQRHSYLKEMRAAVLQWEKYLQALLSTTEGTNGEQRVSGNTGVHNAAA